MSFGPRRKAVPRSMQFRTAKQLPTKGRRTSVYDHSSFRLDPCRSNRQSLTTFHNVPNWAPQRRVEQTHYNCFYTSNKAVSIFDHMPTRTAILLGSFQKRGFLCIIVILLRRISSAGANWLNYA